MCRNEAKAAFLERQAQKDKDLQTELDTGDCGVFALVNNRLGNGSESARRIHNQTAKSSAELAQNKVDYFGSQAGSNGQDSVPQSRRGLMTGQVREHTTHCIRQE